MNQPITEFRGKHFFLSNYYETPFVWRNVEFRSAEQAFAYAKTFFANDPEIEATYENKILSAATPGEAKKLGRAVNINVTEWDKHKVMYMREIVHAKFRTSEESLVGPLTNTGAVMLVEGNTWGDKYWGRVKENGKWVGLNTLGVILMEERGWWGRGSEGRP